MYLNMKIALLTRYLTSQFPVPARLLSPFCNFSSSPLYRNTDQKFGGLLEELYASVFLIINIEMLEKSFQRRQNHR